MHLKQLITICIVLVVLLVGVYLSSERKDKNHISIPTSTPTGILTPIPVQKGFLMLPNPTAHAYAPGSSIELYLYADSEGKNIVGYDAVIAYDAELSEFVRAMSIRPDFDISAVTKGEQVYLTGTKKLSSTDSSIFTSQEVAQLVFTAKKAGKLPFNLMYNPGKTNTSNLITDTNENVLGKVESTTAYAGYTLNLVQGVSVDLDGGASLTLNDAYGIPTTCADCIESATLSVKKGEETQEIPFRTGGIAGFMDIRGSAFGYTFIAERFSDGKLSVWYYQD